MEQRVPVDVGRELIGLESLDILRAYGNECLEADRRRREVELAERRHRENLDADERRHRESLMSNLLATKIAKWALFVAAVSLLVAIGAWVFP